MLSLIDWIYLGAQFLLALAMTAGCWRLLRGPRAQDRVLALDSVYLSAMLLLVTFGIIEFSVALYDKAVITNASREAARAGVVYSVPQLTATQIAGVATSYCQNNLITFGAATTPTVAVDQSAGTSAGNPLKVTISYNYSGMALGSLIAPFTGTLVIKGVTTMKYE